MADEGNPTGGNAGDAGQQAAGAFTQEKVNVMMGQVRKETRERVQKELAEAEAAREALEGKLVEQVLRAAVMREATAMGADPDVAWAMVDRAGLSLDEKGEAAGVKPALEALRKAKPHLFGGTVPGSPSNRAGAGSGGSRVGTPSASRSPTPKPYSG